eukprot:TRINITY_DN2357_c0_g1_i1.p1 TRINITY_DN2357_c0_g1~~TRINITY_DN2357_c0_g1_i1.p1  ORF type:complete len:627 (-),score=183.04 TRINITY_DN2357_c0_g1_i1:107-1879(-)
MSWWKNAADMLSLDKAQDLLEKGKAKAQEAAETARLKAKEAAEAMEKAAAEVQAEYQKTFVELDCKIVYVRPQLVIMEFPTNDTIARLSTRLNTDHPGKMRVYNLSGEKYDPNYFKGEVVAIDCKGQPVLPFATLVELCDSAHTFLQSDAHVGRVVVVHCRNDYALSTMVLGCLMAFRGCRETPAEAAEEVRLQLGLEAGAPHLEPAQRRYLEYFHKWLCGFSPAAQRFRLQELKLEGGVPCCEQEGSVAFRPVMEVSCGGDLLYSDPLGATPEFLAIDSQACIQPRADVVVDKDAAVKLQHVSTSGKPEVVLTLCLHTGFLEGEKLQLSKGELDVACADAKFPSEAVLELCFEKVGDADAQSDGAAALDNARAVSLKFREEEKERREKIEEEKKRLEAEEEAALAAKKQAAPRDPSQDESSELEETLKRNTAHTPARERGGDEASGSAEAEELRKLLAEAAADDEGDTAKPTAAAAAPKEAKAAAKPEVVGGYNAATAAPVAAAAHAAAGKEEAAAQPAEKKAQKDEMDELFGDFDAALDSLTGATGADKPTSSVGTTKEKAEASAKEPKKMDEDLFGDTDAFLKELEG